MLTNIVTNSALSTISSQNVSPILYPSLKAAASSSDPVSSKNRLQELFQKRGEAPPTYKTDRVGGTDHAPQYVSCLTMLDNVTVKSDIHSTRKAAEMDVANRAWDRYFQITYSSFPCRYTLPHVCFLIDLENAPREEAVLLGHVHHLHLHTFVSRSHPLADPIAREKFRKTYVTTFNQTITDHITDSTRKDAVDFHMAVILTKMSVGVPTEKPTFTKYIIITRDHFGEVLAEVLTGVSAGVSGNNFHSFPTAAAALTFLSSI